MVKRLLTLAACILGSSGLAFASEPSCLPVALVVPTALHYTVQPCMSFGLTPGLPSSCLNCPGEESHVLNQTHPVCVQISRGFVVRTVERHVVNGRCVPIRLALGVRSSANPPPPQTEGRIIVPPAGYAPPAQRPPAFDPPHLQPPPRIGEPLQRLAPPPHPAIEHAATQGRRPQP